MARNKSTLADLLVSIAAPVASQSGVREEDRANTADPNARAPKAPKAKAGKIVEPAHVKRVRDGIASLEAVCSKAQMEAIEALAADAYDRQAETLTWDERMDAHLQAIMGDDNKALKRVYFVMVAGLRDCFGAYVATCFRNAVKRRLGELPTKADRRAKGTIKGYSPKKWFRGVDSTLGELADRAAKVAQIANDIPASTLREFMDAMHKVQSAAKRLDRAINE